MNGLFRGNVSLNRCAFAQRQSLASTFRQKMQWLESTTEFAKKLQAGRSLTTQEAEAEYEAQGEEAGGLKFRRFLSSFFDCHALNANLRAG